MDTPEDEVMVQSEIDASMVGYTIDVLKRQVVEATNNGKYSVKAVIFGDWVESTHTLFIQTASGLGYTVTRDPTAFMLYNVSW